MPPPWTAISSILAVSSVLVLWLLRIGAFEPVKSGDIERIAARRTEERVT